MERYGVIGTDGRARAYTFTLAEARRALARAGAGADGARIGVYALVNDEGCTPYLELLGSAYPEDTEALEALRDKARRVF